MLPTFGIRDSEFERCCAVSLCLANPPSRIPHPGRACRGHGFTLIEVLVAVAIIAIVALVVGIGLSGLGGDRELEREATRLKNHIDYACENAVLDGRSMGLVQTAEGYRFVQRMAGQWQPVKDQPALAAHRLPANMQLRLKREDHPLPRANEDTSSTRPQLACLASGEMTPFTAEMEAAGADQRFEIVGHIDTHTEMRHVPRAL